MCPFNRPFLDCPDEPPPPPPLGVDGNDESGVDWNATILPGTDDDDDCAAAVEGADDGPRGKLAGYDLDDARGWVDGVGSVEKSEA